jgi:predicted transcriptional regulator
LFEWQQAAIDAGGLLPIDYGTIVDLTRWFGDRGVCFCAGAALAARLGVSEPTAEASLRRLRGSGLLEIVTDPSLHTPMKRGGRPAFHYRPAIPAQLMSKAEGQAEAARRSAERRAKEAARKAKKQVEQTKEATEVSRNPLVKTLGQVSDNPLGKTHDRVSGVSPNEQADQSPSTLGAILLTDPMEDADTPSSVSASSSYSEVETRVDGRAPEGASIIVTESTAQDDEGDSLVPPEVVLLSAAHRKHGVDLPGHAQAIADRLADAFSFDDEPAAAEVSMRLAGAIVGAGPRASAQFWADHLTAVRCVIVEGLFVAEDREVDERLTAYERRLRSEVARLRSAGCVEETRHVAS